MKISVITVCRNSEPTIAHTIRSFLAQTHEDKEMVVVDGCSTDRTLDVIRSFDAPSIRIFSEPDKGIYDAMNKGLRLYSGDACGFLNSDDVFHDSYVLEKIAAGLRQADVVYGDVLFVNNQIENAPFGCGGGKFHPRLLSLWLAGRRTRHSIIRRALADAVGPFDLSYGMSSDYDYMLRAMEVQSPRVQYLPHTLVDFMHGGSTTETPLRYISGNLLA
jgi:glycosyltransferase